MRCEEAHGALPLPEIIRTSTDREPTLGGTLTPPEITPEVAERSVARLTRVPLGYTSGTCNPAVADVDGDGLDEIAVPFNRGEEDVIALLRGDGSVVSVELSPIEPTVYGPFRFAFSAPVADPSK